MARSGTPSGRLSAAFAVRAALAVALVHSVVFIPYALHWYETHAYTIVSTGLSALAVGLVAFPLARVLDNLRNLLAWSGDDAEKSLTDVSGAWSGLDAELASLHERTVRRMAELSAARDAVRLQNLTHRRAADHLKQAQRIARVGSWEWERAGNRVSCSGEVFRLLRLDPDAFKPSPAALLDLMHADDRRAFRRWLVRLSHGETSHGFDLRMHTQGGELLHLHLLGEPMHENDRTIGVVGTIQDATERTHAIQQIHRLAYYDVLTELPNRSRFHEKLGETLEASRRGGKPFALMFLDLDRFKRINDTLGHAVGDELLRIVAQRLTRVLRVDEQRHAARGKSSERDVCRQGGDEFIVLLNGVQSEEQAARAANRVIETLAQPIQLGAQEVFVSASIGIVLFPRDGEDIDTLLKNADVAMYHAKSEGRNRYAFYRDSMRRATAERLSLEHDLRRAIEAQQFELHFQPQIDLQSGRIVALEALVRWNHPTLGMLWPQHFIQVAEEAGLIMAIWEWVFVSALIQHNQWQQDGLPRITIGVNMSSMQFNDPVLAARVQEIARVVGVPLDDIELEITESALMQDFDDALATLQSLCAMGVKLAIDDFGTGYSSLSYLRRLPLHKLKLDHAFTADIVESDEGAAIARAIIAMAHSLGLAVVAEGIETEQQIELLFDLGCTTMQGFLLSRPLPAAAMTEVLQRYAAGGTPASDAVSKPEPPAIGPSSIAWH
jgi:diguanylate cyclase (GGDEF)-like protein